MEDEGILDPLNEIHLYALHAIFLPLINRALNELTRDWNHHPMSTAHNLSPQQLWHLGLTRYQNTNQESYEELVNFEWESFGIDHENPLPSDDNEIIIPEIITDLSLEQQNYINTEIRNLDDSNSEDIDKYIFIVNLINRITT